MSRSPAFLSEVSGDEVLDQWRSLNATTRDALIIGGAFTLVIGIVVVWAVFIRKPKRRHHHHGHHRSRPAASAEPRSTENGDETGPRRKIRRQRRPHRQMNPTLAETGGLPPMRNSGRDDAQF